MANKTVGDFEKEYGCILPDHKPGDKMTQEEFDAIPLREKVGVNHNDRIAFLQANGYEVNRKNMVDSSLSTKSGEEEN